MYTLLTKLSIHSPTHLRIRNCKHISARIKKGDHPKVVIDRQPVDIRQRDELGNDEVVRRARLRYRVDAHEPQPDVRLLVDDEQHAPPRVREQHQLPRRAGRVLQLSVDVDLALQLEAGRRRVRRAPEADLHPLGVVRRLERVPADRCGMDGVQRHRGRAVEVVRGQCAFRGELVVLVLWHDVVLERVVLPLQRRDGGAVGVVVVRKIVLGYAGDARLFLVLEKDEYIAIDSGST